MSKVLLIAILLISIAGCDEDDKQVAQVAQESAQRQAEQNQEMAKLNREVASGTRRLVEADSKARRELIVAQKELAQQHDKLEVERRDLAALRYRESLLAPVISGLGLLLLCALPLVLAWYLLQGWREETAAETAIGNLLLEELVSERPLLLPQAITEAAKNIVPVATTATEAV